jgi:hypothetical protein
MLWVWIMGVTLVYDCTANVCVRRNGFERFKVQEVATEEFMLRVQAS